MFFYDPCSCSPDFVSSLAKSEHLIPLHLSSGGLSLVLTNWRRPAQKADVLAEQIFKKEEKKEKREH